MDDRWSWVAKWSERLIADGWVNVVVWTGARKGQVQIGTGWWKGRKKGNKKGSTKGTEMDKGTEISFSWWIVILQWARGNWKLPITDAWHLLAIAIYKQHASSLSTYLCSIPCRGDWVMKRLALVHIGNQQEYKTHNFSSGTLPEKLRVLWN